MNKINSEIESPSRNKIFLGGACTSDWRGEIIPALDYYGVRYFNPVVKDWTPECIEMENLEKYGKCNIHLYYFDSSMTGSYSVAELVKSCYDTVEYAVNVNTGESIKTKNTDLVLFVVNTDGYSESQIRSFDATASLLRDITNKLLFMKITKNDLKEKFLNALKDAANLDFSSEDDDDIYEDDEE